MQRAHKWLPVFGLFCVLLWTLGTALQNYALIMLGAAPVVVLLISAVMYTVALPLAIVIHALHERKRKSLSRPLPESIIAPRMNRRAFLRHGAAALPAFSVMSGWTGVAESFETVRIPNFTFQFHDLPPALHGFKICQLSDMHLGYFRGLRDMEQLFEKVAAQQPDLVLVTGDIADDLSLLPDILRLLAELKPPHGVYAALGNHEYYRGIKTVRKHFEASTIPLLCNTGVAVPVHEATLFIGGIDDPSRSRRTDYSTFFPQSVETALLHAPHEAFKILMSHRPTAFYPATEFGVQLTLAGHTHGAQLGYNGRSVLELGGSEKLLWGHYQRGAAQLYTTCGVGHWFPFRLGCPPEAPMMVLEKAS
ncbi:metallophosphoesterase [candidate division KSB1 bacterium]|nr:metallophosphoesterase [candidate division KSB1 bacterium]